MRLHVRAVIRAAWSLLVPAPTSLWVSPALLPAHLQRQVSSPKPAPWECLPHWTCPHHTQDFLFFGESWFNSTPLVVCNNTFLKYDLKIGLFRQMFFARLTTFNNYKANCIKVKKPLKHKKMNMTRSLQWKKAWVRTGQESHKRFGARNYLGCNKNPYTNGSMKGPI